MKIALVQATLQNYLSSFNRINLFDCPYNIDFSTKRNHHNYIELRRWCSCLERSTRFRKVEHSNPGSERPKLLRFTAKPSKCVNVVDVDLKTHDSCRKRCSMLNPSLLNKQKHLIYTCMSEFEAFV